jgi:hypothetical protein
VSWLIAGTVPRADFGLEWGAYDVRDGVIRMAGRSIGVARGTPALMAVACIAARVLGVDSPEAILAGDIGTGEGSQALYGRLAENAGQVRHKGVTFHYLMPDIAGHNKVLWALEGLPRTPLLVADAGFMYAAKMSGFATHYDLFTPDAGEMAFLADETAPHPFYTRGFLLQEEERIPELVQTAHASENSARHLLVKGRTDYVVAEGKILSSFCEPDTPAMEPIGGTGDTVTGFVTALLAAGHDIPEACAIAARANRFLGHLANPTPAFGVADLLPYVPEALEMALAG